MLSQSERLQLRESICRVGKKLYDKGFVAANDGNISIKMTDQEILITPTGVSKGDMKPEDLIVVNPEGELIRGHAMPSSESKMHLEVYRVNQTARAVVHAHPPIATAFAVNQKAMDLPIIAEAVVNLGVIPVADYALPGTDQVPNSIRPFLREYNAVLLSNHGLLTWGRDMTEAFFRMETAEHYGKILLYSRQIGHPKTFSAEQIDELIKIRRKLGIETGGVPSV